MKADEVVKAVLHQVISTAQKIATHIFVGLGLLPQMQAFEHRLRKRL